MAVAREHRIGRQSVDLVVASEAVARALHAELAGTFTGSLGTVLDEVLTASCPEGDTIRLTRVLVDAGTVSRDELMHALAESLRAQLPPMLAAVERAAAAGEPSPPGAVRLSAWEAAFDRLALFLELGVATWRDAGLGVEAIEESLQLLIDERPSALRRLLERVPAAAAAARLWTLRPAARHRLLEWLGIDQPARLDAAVAEWMAVGVELASEGGPRTQSPHTELRRSLVEHAWRATLSQTPRGDLFTALGEPVLRVRAAGSPVELARRLAAVARAARRVLPRESAVRRIITKAMRQARANRDPDRAAARETPERPTLRANGARQPASDGSTLRGPSAIWHERDADLASAAGVEGSSGRHVPDASPSSSPAAPDERRGSDIAPVISHLAAQTTPGFSPDEPLWAAHAGAVILWPFLPGLFDACGLVAGKRFVDDEARARAVLLIAHLASGRVEWGEHELLVERLLCGGPDGQPGASLLDLRSREREQALELLQAVIGHWPILKSTSVEGLRQAFLSRPGTVTATASSWKLEVPRAGHDVLLDSLPWGIGVVLLPWMSQPLHVEW